MAGLVPAMSIERGLKLRHSLCVLTGGLQLSEAQRRRPLSFVATRLRQEQAGPAPCARIRETCARNFEYHPMSEPEQPGDPGLKALVMVLRFHGVAADPAQIRHQLGMARVGVAEMVRIAKQFDLKARVRTTTWSRLAHTPKPALAALRDGGLGIL